MTDVINFPKAIRMIPHSGKAAEQQVIDDSLDGAIKTLREASMRMHLNLLEVNEGMLDGIFWLFIKKQGIEPTMRWLADKAELVIQAKEAQCGSHEKNDP